MKKDSGQALVIVLFIIIIFTLVVVTIASLTTREVELREIDEMAAKAGYTAESGEERARYVLKGSALKFDGVDDYVLIKNGSLIANEPNSTIEAWVKLNNDLTTEKAVYDESTSTGTVFRLRIRSDERPDFSLQIGSSFYAATSSEAILPNQWYHLVGTLSSSQGMKIYVNGLERGANSNTSICGYTPNYSWIGRYRQGYYFPGLIDEVRVYRRTLGPEEVLDHYNGKYTNESGLVLLQHFEEGPDNCNISASPATVCLSDDSENNNNGTPSGFTSNKYDDLTTLDSGWTRNYPYERSIFIGDIKQSGITLSSCPDSKFSTSEHSCGDKNVIGDYYYNVTITRFGDQRPEGKGVCNQLVCIDSGGQNVE